MSATTLGMIGFIGWWIALFAIAVRDHFREVERIRCQLRHERQMLTTAHVAVREFCAVIATAQQKGGSASFNIEDEGAAKLMDFERSLGEHLQQYAEPPPQ